MKKVFFLISAFIGLISCKSGINVSIENPSDFDRLEIVEIPVEKLMALPSGKAYLVTDQKDETTPSQLTYDGKLIFQTNVKAKETIFYTVKIGTPDTFPSKTYGRFITERKDDFAWENDRVAFRIYGPALIAVDGPSNGIDLWYKKTNNLIIDKWYQDDIAGVRSYHEDHGEGLDDYKVGRTLGGGMMAPFENDTLILNENFAEQELLENGPLRTTFKLTYKDITVNGKTFGESRTFSIDAGSQLTKVTQEYKTNDTLTVAAGIVKRARDDEAYTAYTDNGVAAVVYEEPAGGDVGKVFVGMIFPKGIERTLSHTDTIIHPKTQKEEIHSYVLAVTSYYPGQPVTYYTGYGWEKFGFPTLSDFRDYMGYFSKGLEELLIIKIL
ncbi:MAG: DUF4861 domain-containing protein [Tannerella sp.]|jgi:hypothetical protein|nr:DUF4861 domain-containing protein [Tannerella sp.]